MKLKCLFVDKLIANCAIKVVDGLICSKNVEN